MSNVHEGPPEESSIAQAKADVDAALLLIGLGHLEPAQELLRFASTELADAFIQRAPSASRSDVATQAERRPDLLPAFAGERYDG
jgi:hypothetical protein